MKLRSNFIFQPSAEIGYTHRVAELIFNIDMFALEVDRTEPAVDCGSLRSWLWMWGLFFFFFWQKLDFNLYGFIQKSDLGPESSNKAGNLIRWHWLFHRDQLSPTKEYRVRVSVFLSFCQFFFSFQCCA